MNNTMKIIYALLSGTLLCLTSCEKNEAEPEAAQEKFYIEFLVSGRENISISQKEDSTVQVNPSAVLPTGSDLSKMEFFSRLSGSSMVTLHFSHTTDFQVRDLKGNTSEAFFEYIRNTVMPKPVKFYPADNSEGLTFSLEYYDHKTQNRYYSFLLKPQGGSMVAVSGNQRNSSFVIANHYKFKATDMHYKYFESELIEGTFNMMLYSATDSIMVTNGKFKTFLTLD